VALHVGKVLDLRSIVHGYSYQRDKAAFGQVGQVAQLIFCSVSVKYDPISIKTCRPVLEETLNKNVQKYPLYLKYVLALLRKFLLRASVTKQYRRMVTFFGWEGDRRPSRR